MAKIKNRVGQRFGKLVVNEYHGKNYKNRVLWRCVCDCGNEKIAASADLGRRTNSCGCIVGGKTTHGMSDSKTYKSWTLMRSRCNTPTDASYKYYGGRGIKICRRWEIFENFFADMGEKPKDFTLDRKNNMGDYTPENCQWADWFQQARNKRNNRIIEHNGIKKPMSEWAEIYSIKVATLWRRLSIGMVPPECFLAVGQIPRGAAARSQQANDRFTDKAHT